MFGIGPPELIVIMILALIVFGPDRLPQIAAQVGKAVRDFRQMSSELTGEFNRTINAAEVSMTNLAAPLTGETAATAETDRQASTATVVAPDQAPGDEALRLAEEHAATVSTHAYEDAGEADASPDVLYAPASDASSGADDGPGGDTGAPAPSDVLVFRPVNAPVHAGKPAVFSATPTAFGGAVHQPAPAAVPSAEAPSASNIVAGDAEATADDATVWHWRPAAPLGTAVANSSSADPHAG